MAIKHRCRELYLIVNKLCKSVMKDLVFYLFIDCFLRDTIVIKLKKRQEGLKRNDYNK